MIVFPVFPKDDAMIRTSRRFLTFLTIILFSGSLLAQDNKPPAQTAAPTATQPAPQRSEAQRDEYRKAMEQADQKICRRSHSSLRADEKSGIPDHPDRCATHRVAANAGCQRLDTEAFQGLRDRRASGDRGNCARVDARTRDRRDHQSVAEDGSAFAPSGGARAPPAMSVEK